MDFNNNEEKKDISFEPFDFALKENINDFLPGYNQFFLPVTINENANMNFFKPLPIINNFFAESLDRVTQVDVNLMDNKTSNEKTQIILEYIQKNNPVLLKNLEFYGVPNNIINFILKEIIDITLTYK